MYKINEEYAYILAFIKEARFVIENHFPMTTMTVSTLQIQSRILHFRPNNTRFEQFKMDLVESLSETVNKTVVKYKVNPN